jgi:hypothetical protein
VHDTPSRTLSCEGTLGLGTIDQFVPFHISTSVWRLVPLLSSPTAAQAEGPAHETAVRSLSSEEEVFGLGTIDQWVPFHISTSVWRMAPLL